VNYKLRDWLFSRQRYWGEPFPIVFDAAGNHYPVSESALPVRLPEMEHYKPGESDDPQPMLASAPSEWLNTTAGKAGVDPSILPPETPVRREANTMPNWAGSCWYYLRFSDPKNAGRFVGKEAEAYWLGKNGVDLYIGGSEHAVLHLLYARFWHKALYDLGHVSSAEPMRRLFHQGLITSYAYQRKDRTLAPVDQVTMVRADGSAVALVGDPRVDRVEEAEKFVETATDEPLQQVVAKMSKSLKNVVNPDDVIAEFGADTMRLYEMYMGPLEATKPWNPRDITGLFRFLQRAWRMMIDEKSGQARLAAAPDEKVERELHRTIARLGPQIERLSFNTAIADLIKFVNAVPASIEAAGSLTKVTSRAVRPSARPLSHRIWRRDVVAFRATPSRSPTSPGRFTRRPCCANPASRFPCRSWASSAAASPCPPALTTRPWKPRRWPTRLSSS
jgi:leucyl-tRNA synthetase